MHQSNICAFFECMDIAFGSYNFMERKETRYKNE